MPSPDAMCAPLGTGAHLNHARDEPRARIEQRHLLNHAVELAVELSKPPFTQINVRLWLAGGWLLLRLRVRP